jgi:phosphomannomutase
MLYTDTNTGFPIADIAIDPLQGPLPTTEELEMEYKRMIISASGWRKVFAQSKDEEDAAPEISLVDRYLIALATESFYRERNPKKVLVGIDTRPTGPAIANIVNRILLAHDVDVRYLFITAAPEIMAYSSYQKQAQFFYITASHNPIGHNGFKFGSAGGVFDSIEATQIIATFRTLITDPESPALVQRLSASVSPERYGIVLNHCASEKSEALAAYERLVLDIAADSEDELDYGDLIAQLRHEISQHPIGIVGELNGSARSVSIDKEFLSGLGIKTHFVHNLPRDIAHAIVPEGENLELCRTILQEAHQKDPAFILGYVPDNDGDRGNIVYYNENTHTTHILGAQELFALVATVELSLSKRDAVPQAIVVNGPTSLMIDAIADRLGVSAFRAEVGEANVVRLAQQVRSRGYSVRILGEGSNGGNITHPGKVRDPLNTLVSLIKLLSSPERFASITGMPLPPHTSPTLSRALAALPQRTITGAFSREAIMQITSHNHGDLKAAYERLFVIDYAQRSDELENIFSICGWREEQTEGTSCKEGMGPDFRTPPMRGGLKIIFSNALGDDTDFIWMRGSGTEPVFRIMADALGHDQKRHDYLLFWHRDLIARADAEISSQKSSSD